MSSRHLAVLVRTELRRFRPAMLRMAGTTAVVVPLLVAVDARQLLHFVLLAFGIGIAMQMPLELVRDRISGDLLLLSVLPIPASTVAAAKFLSSAVLCALAGVFYAVSAGLSVPTLIPSLTPLEAALGAFLASWLFFSVSSFVSAAFLARLGVQALTGGLLPVAVLAALLGGSWLLELWVPDPRAGLEWLLAQPWLPVAVSGACMVAAALVSALALRVASAGIRDYRPEPDALSW